MNRLDPWGLYVEDVHYYLTNFLCNLTGCFEGEECEEIAQCDQAMDEWTSTYGWSLFNPTFWERHFSGDLAGLREDVGCDLCSFGMYLHSMQDSYAHEGHGFPLGHGLESFAAWLGFSDYPDLTGSDPGTAMGMAAETLASLAWFARNCSCCDVDWIEVWNSVRMQIAAFVTSSDDEEKREALGGLDERDRSARPADPFARPEVPDPNPKINQAF